MHYSEFLRKIKKFWPNPYPTSRRFNAYWNAQMLETAMGVSEEAGEVLGVIKMHVFRNQQLDQRKLLKEIGDVCHQLTMLADLAGLSMAVVMESNVSKLETRFPDGYTDEAAAKKADEVPLECGDEGSRI